MRALPFFLNARVIVIIDFRRFDAFAWPTKARLFVLDALRFAPKRFITWSMKVDEGPGMAKIRENRKCAREVAVKLVEDKKQELTSGKPQKDLLSLLGSSYIAPAKIYR